MNNDPLQTIGLPSQQDPVKRVACIRCRTQKLKCIKSTHASVTSRCDRCRKADVQCTYAASKPMGRPRTARSRQANQMSQSPTSQSDKTTTPQPCDSSHEPLDFDTFVDDADQMLDTQSMNVFLDDMTPFDHHSDASTSQGLGLTASEFEFLTPCSSQSILPFPNSFDAYMATIPLEGEAPETHVGTAASAYVSEGTQRDSMQHLARIGLDLYAQVTKYQKAGDNVVIADLVRDVLHSSTDYLNRLLSLDGTFVTTSHHHHHHQQQQHCKIGLDWSDGQSYPQQPQQLDMPAAFQLLIPYVRLVQLHNILYRALLRCLSSDSSNSNSNSSISGNSSRSGPIATTLAAAAHASSSFPDLSVGGMCINAGDPLRARLLLQMNVHLLAEIETTLELPHEARICCSSDYEGSIGGAMGFMSTKEPGAAAVAGSGGLVLRKTVSPRLLKTILDERNLGGDDVQSMRDRIAYIKCLLRYSMLQA
ncbi:Zn2-Cys6 DNA-binding protein [Pyrenophora teres f. teres]|uniref:Zn2-Cys6 DNA-binding protein n=1 Tax=Pyrenophora teres f. teres TaxID=97479 RepID=A0A6S6WAR8_9PLEO|nr:Zn2-Cys6 DNA-binding protein [Pyrenophora teres f. teres]